MSTNTLKALPLAALVAAAVIGCGDRDDASPRTTATPPAGTSMTTSPGGATAGGNSSSSAGTPSMAGGNPAQQETTTAAGNSTGAATAGSTATGGSATGSATAGGNAPASGSIDGSGAALAMIDRNFVTTAAAGGMFEVEASKLAAGKATDPAVKAFASMLVEHHTKVNDELKRLASTKNVTLPAELPTDKKAQLQKLQSVSGAAFDRQYVQEVGIKDHQQDIRSFEKASRDAKDPQVKAWAQKTLPTLREHYAKAQTLPGGGEKAQTTGRAPTQDGSETRGGVAAATGTPGAGDSAAAGGNSSATPPPPTTSR